MSHILDFFDNVVKNGDEPASTRRRREWLVPKFQLRNKKEKVAFELMLDFWLGG
jgi:hypothetical protein